MAGTKKRGYHPSCEWYTPPEVWRAVEAFFGVIDLDPCANPEKTIPARLHLLENGLDATWRGKVYVNPPYAPRIQPWVEKALSDPVDEMIMLLPSRTDAAWMHLCFNYTVCFVRDRIEFWHPGHTKERAAFGNVFVYRGTRPLEFAEHFQRWGHIYIGEKSNQAMCPAQLPLSLTLEVA